MRRVDRTWQIAGLLFGSGFCALVYQIGWLREFRLIFGASTAASAAVLAIFIGGLGIGALILGPCADRHPRPLRYYAQLEAVVAVSAAVSPYLLAFTRTLYLSSGGAQQLGTVAATGFRLALTALVLAVPTIAMGGTLPAAARAATEAGDLRRQGLATLYALNTLGAVAGSAAATFFLLERLGTRQTVWLAAAANLVIAVVAANLAASLVSDPTGATPEFDRSGGGAGRLAPASLSPPVETSPVSTAFLLTASGLVGFAFFVMELVWYRLLSPLLGGSVFTFGLILALALFGVGLGGLLYARVAGDRPATLNGFATSCLLEAACVAGTFALGDRLAVLTVRLQPQITASFTSNVVAWALVAGLVVLPPAVIAGFQFPLLIALFGRGRERIGREIGLAYASNTAGAIAGSLAGGFGFLPWLSATGTWRLVAAVLLLLGGAAAVLGTSTRRWAWMAAHGVIAALTIGFAFAPGPSAVWRHSGIGARRAPSSEKLQSPNNLKTWMRHHRNIVVWDGDGRESGVALVSDEGGLAFIVNGKSDGSARGDAGTQVMLGLLGAIKHPDPHRALVVGLGTGSTAGWLAAVPSIDRVDVVELEPLVLEVARACHAVNQGVMNNPRVSIVIGDARETLLTSRQQYDVIASEPSNPYRAGVASLFTQEFYRAAARRLTDDGVFAQWVQAYEIDSRTLATIYATMGSVFADVETWQTARGDLVLLGTLRARPYDIQEVTQRIAEQPFSSALRYVWRTMDVHGWLAHHVANDTVMRTIVANSNAPINTDDRNVVEFGLARAVGRPSNLAGAVRQRAQESGGGHPRIVRGDSVRWPAVETAWVSFDVADGEHVTATIGSPNEQARQDALRRYFENDDAAGARESWKLQAEPPRDLNELAMVADAEARTGSEAALTLIEQLKGYQPGEADTLLAVLRFQQSRLDQAAEALDRAFARFRVDPWAARRYEQKALELARVVGSDPQRARRLFEALDHPFASATLNEKRLFTRAELATSLPEKHACLDPVSAFGRYAPWNEWFLGLRRDCYRDNGDSRLELASLDLLEYLAHEAPALPLEAATSSPR